MPKVTSLKNVLCVLLLTFAAVILPAQTVNGEDPLVSAFRENFSRAGDETKLDVLKDSVNYSPSEMGPLYKDALDYVVNNSDQLQANAALQGIASMAAQLAGISTYAPAASSMWDLFESYSETRARVTILAGLSKDKLGDERSLLLLNRWLERQISVFKAGGGLDAQVVSQAVTTLNSFRDPRSFSVLLSLSVLGLPQGVSAKAEEALRSIDGDYSSMASGVIESATPAEKLVALNTAISREGLSAEDRAGVAMKALEVGNSLSLSDPSNAELIRQLRGAAASVLKELRWAEGTAELIRHFDLCVLEYDRGIGSKPLLLESIAALGAMGTREAAVRLALYLDVTNSFVESHQGYDEQIALAVVRNLGALKSKAGLNALLYLGYLDYSKRILDAGTEARNAILGQ